MALQTTKRRLALPHPWTLVAFFFATVVITLSQLITSDCNSGYADFGWPLWFMLRRSSPLAWSMPWIDLLAFNQNQIVFFRPIALVFDLAASIALVFFFCICVEAYSRRTNATGRFSIAGLLGLMVFVTVAIGNGASSWPDPENRNWVFVVIWLNSILAPSRWLILSVSAYGGVWLIASLVYWFWTKNTGDEFE